MMPICWHLCFLLLLNHHHVNVNRAATEVTRMPLTTSVFSKCLWNDIFSSDSTFGVRESVLRGHALIWVNYMCQQSDSDFQHGSVYLLRHMMGCHDSPSWISYFTLYHINDEASLLSAALLSFHSSCWEERMKWDVGPHAAISQWSGIVLLCPGRIGPTVQPYSNPEY